MAIVETEAGIKAEFLSRPKPRGRPTLYDPAIAAEILARLSTGETLRQICRDDHMPAASTVCLWNLRNISGFAEHYARAREDCYEAWADEIIEISDDGSNDWMDRETAKGRMIRVQDQETQQRSRLRCDNRKWLLSKLLPHKYGDKLEVSGTITVDIAPMIDAARKRLVEPESSPVTIEQNGAEEDRA